MAEEKKKRHAKDFNYQEVGPKDLDISDPAAADALAAGKEIDREYPKHLHKAVAPGHAHEYVVVDNPAQERQYRSAGYMSAKEADAVNEKAADKAPAPAKAAKPKAPKSGKPRNPKPKAKPAAEV